MKNIPPEREDRQGFKQFLKWQLYLCELKAQLASMEITLVRKAMDYLWRDWLISCSRSYITQQPFSPPFFL